MNKNEKNLSFIVHGYRFIDESVVKNKNFQKCLELLPSLSFYRTSPIKKELIPMISERIIDTHFKRIDQGVLFLEEEEFHRIYKDYLPPIEEYMNIISKKAKRVSIYHLPIHYREGNSMQGEIKKLLIDTEKVELLQSYHLIFSGIELGNQIDYLSPPTHCHEITHGLIEKNKGSIENYLNAEVLSMWMEKLAALDMSEGLLRVIETNRLAALKERTNSLKSKEVILEEDLESYQYLYSGFLAEQLFTLYLEGNRFIRKQLESEIAKVFQGDLILEDLLSSKEIDYHNEEVVKSLKKAIDERTIHETL